MSMIVNKNYKFKIKFNFITHLDDWYKISKTDQRLAQ